MLEYAVNDIDILDNCAAWWPLNEKSDGTGAVTRYDAHGQNHLTDVGTVPSANGVVNRCADLERSNSEYFSVNDNAALSITGDMSVALNVTIEAALTSGLIEYQLFNKYLGTGNQRSFALTYIYNGGTPAIQVITSANGSTINYGNVSQTLTPGTRYHIVAVYDASAGSCEIFVDDVSIGTITGLDTSLFDSTAPVQIGAQNGSYTLDGKVQDVALFSTALTAAQRGRLYNNGDYMTYGVDFDNETGDYSNGHTRGTDRTFSHETKGENRVLRVGVICSVAGTVTGAKYNGVAMTLVDSYASAPGIFNETLYFELVNPAEGTNTVAIETTGSGTVYLYSNAISYIGVDQTTPSPHSGKNTGTNTSLTLSIDTSGAPSTDNCWLAGIGATDGNYTQSAGAGTTRRPTGLIHNWLSGFDTNAAISPAASDSLVVNTSTSNAIHVIAASLSPVQPIVDTSDIKSIAGVATADIKSLAGLTL